MCFLLTGNYLRFELVELSQHSLTNYLLRTMAEQLFDKVRDMISAIKDAAPTSSEELEQFRIQFLGSKNRLKPLMGEIRNVINERKKEYGQLVNEAKQVAEAKFAEIVSLRYTRPGAMMRMGGCVVFIVRACTEEVCVRKSWAPAPGS